MARVNNQKLKIMYLMKILLDRTDETHSITMPDIISALEAYGINSERKSIYSDIENLRLFGLDVIGEKKGALYHYSIGNRQFELAELKLLVDSVQAAKFITAKKSNQLIKKIEGLASRYEAARLQRQVYVMERIKTMNENIFYNVDILHSAIGDNLKIKFHYANWNVNKEMVLRRDGAYYHQSPWALSWDDENYYLIAFDSDEKKIKHFRVDKMLHIEIMEEHREGREEFRNFDTAVYAKKLFGMYSGEEQNVRIRCENSFAGVMFDRFGRDISLKKTDDDHFEINVKVAVSRQFIAWVLALGEGVKIIGSAEIVKQVKQEVNRLVKQYSDTAD